ncbi:50S ribosomal protein L4 [Candidatus Woesearchaeota archaeon]|nr:50S ribosomal protein L4 [Candidatus Woesearchaeota archaeon]
MKLAILDQANSKVGEIKLPLQFEEEFRPDLIQRAVLTIQSHKRQAYAASTSAGKRASAKLSRRRRDYRGSYGIGISRVPRKIMTRRGTRMNWVGAFAPGTVGGRRAHPPKSEKIWWKKINNKEKAKAIRSAIAATIMKEVVAERGHLMPNNYPFVLDDKFESVSKTKDVIGSFIRLGFGDELERIKEKKVRAGKGKVRGRKYKKKKGPLIVVSKIGKLSRAATNIQGIDVVDVKSLNTELLAPGAKAGRLVLWTTAAINILEKENLFK